MAKLDIVDANYFRTKRYYRSYSKYENAIIPQAGDKDFVRKHEYS